MDVVWSEEVLLAALYAQSPLSTIVYDLAGHVRFANTAFERLFGLRATDLPADYSILGDTVVLPPVRYVATPSMGVTSTTWTQAQLFPLRDAGGAVRAIVLQHIDLTERLEAEATLRAGEARSTLLAEAGVMLASSLDHAVTLGAIARLVVPALADFCIIDLLVDDGTAIERVATAHADPSRGGLLRELRRFPPSLDSGGIVTRTLASGLPQLESPLESGDLDASATSGPEHAAILEQLAADALLCVPLVARGGTIGTLLLASAGSGRRYSEAEVPVAAELARRAALAVDNARLHQAALTAREASERAVLDVRAILGSISDPFVVYDDAWQFQYINDAALDVFRSVGTETPESDLLGANVWDAYPLLRGTGIEQAMRHVAETRVAATFEQLQAHDRHWIEISCYPMPSHGLAATWRDITPRKRAEEAEHFVSEAARILGSSLDHGETLESLARLVVPQLADWCAVDLLSEAGSIERVAVGHVDPERVTWAHEFNRRFPSHIDDASGVGAVIRSGNAEIAPQVTDEMLAASVADPEQLALLRILEIRSVIVVPLAVRGRNIGALSLVSTGNGRQYDSDDLQLALELATRAAVAVDNARLHQASVAAERAAAAYALDADRFRRALAESPDAFALFDVLRDGEGRVVDFLWNWANAAALRVQGATLDAIRGQRMVQRNPGIATSGLFAGYVRAVDTGEPFEEEVHYRHEWIDTWFRVSAVAHDGGLAVTFADVTARRLADVRTRALYELTRALAVASSRTEVGDVVLERLVPLMAADASSLLEFDAERDELALIAEFGFDASALRGWQRYSMDSGTPGADAIRSRDLVVIPDYEQWRTHYPRHVAWARAHGVEGTVTVPLLIGARALGVVTLHVNGARKFNAHELDFLRAFGDQCAGALERVRLFEGERRMRETAEAANRSKTEFLASMSHELRTPLNAIGGYADLLLLGVRGPMTPVQTLDVERINRSQRHLLSVINDILNFARVEAGFADYVMEPVAVDNVIAEVVPLVLPQLQARQLAFTREPVDAALVVFADGEKVRQILLNLVSNAIKFTPERGHVWVSAHRDGERAHIVVRDTGVGIPADRLAAVFEPFVQLDRSLTRPVEGTGLGLAISRDLARGMNGELSVESVRGEGTTFTLSLPIAPPP